MAYADKIRKFLENAQSYSDTKKKFIILSITGISALILFIFWLNGFIKKIDENQLESPNVNFIQYDISGSLTADWKTYTNEKYGFEIKYPKDWIVDFNPLSYVNEGAGSALFCPPELQNEEINGFTGKKGSCMVGKTNGGSIDPKAPIALLQCDLDSKSNLENCKTFQGKELGTDVDGKYFYMLAVYDPTFQMIYSQMAPTFKFLNSEK